MDKKTIFEKLTKTRLVSIAFILIAFSMLINSWFNKVNFDNLNDQVDSLTSHIESLENKLSSTTDDLKGNIDRTNSSLSNALNEQKQSVGNLEQSLRQEVGSVSSTVSTLQKLSKTDPQLLAKYSKVFFLNENYAPARLTEIPKEYRYSDDKVLKLDTQVWPYMQRMINDAKNAGVIFYAYSAYRSFNEQQALKGQYSVQYGAGTANSFSADQGYSEHQLGSTADFIAPGLGGVLDGFDGTKAYQWLANNAFRYGFILSYPKSNKFYVYEPWHWRFVGVKLATDLHNQHKNFYDLDQRDIDEYLVNLFD